MSSKYPGGIISKTAPVPSGPYADSTAPGIWTLEQQAAYAKLGQWPTAGNANPNSFIENLFSTYLYTGNSPSTQSIVNGIDLATYGGLVWCKSRVSGDGSTYNNILMDTARGTGSGNILYSNSTLAAQTAPNAGISSYNSNGFSLRYDDGYGTNYPSGGTFVSWTFREQPKFFDIVTYTGDGTAGRNISHSLGSVPGCIIVKCVTQNEPWYVYHQALGNTKTMVLNTTDAEGTDPSWNNTTPTASVFTVGSNSQVNFSGRTYVAYLFAHNAGGFGLTGTDNVISCGSFTVDGSGNSSINLGYEPQWLLMKQTNTTGSWLMQDTMRGQTADNGYARLLADTSGAETSTTTGFIRINATGFSTNGATGLVGDHIYIAIRRGPMKVPTDATKVFAPVLANGGNTTITTNFPVDLLINKPPSSTNAPYFMDRLRGGTTSTYNILQSSSTDAELVGSGLGLGFQSNVGIQSSSSFYSSGTSVMWLNFRRAPSFFDEVCYVGSGTGALQTLNHNLTVAPELLIVKKRSAAQGWRVYSSGTPTPNNYYLSLAQTIAQQDAGEAIWNTSATTFAVSAGLGLTTGGDTYVAYLFATCAGVSKVGSYTGTGTTLQIDCGFTAGSRFVLIKRTDSTGDWYVWDSARGIVAGNDPYLLLNSTAAEVTGTDYVDTYSAGFEISSTAPASINANGGTFIFLAIA